MKWFKQFELVWIPVSDMEAAMSFYRDTLELAVVMEDPDTAWVEFQLSEGAKLAIHSVKAVNASPVGAIVLETENIEQSELWLRGKGIKLFDKEEIPGQVKLASFQDPDGNVIQLAQSLQ